MDLWDFPQKGQKWIVLGIFALVASAVAYRLVVPLPKQEAPTENPDTALSDAGSAEPEPLPPPSAPPPAAAQEKRESSKPQAIPIRRVDPESKPPPLEVPKLVYSIHREPPIIVELVSAPHVPTYPAHRLAFDWTPGMKLTAEEETQAINISVVVNLTTALKTALLRGDETTARATMESLRSYGDLAAKALEVEQLNATNGELSDAFRRIREQIAP